MTVLHWKGQINKRAFRDRWRDALLRELPQARISASGELELEVLIDGLPGAVRVGLEESYARMGQDGTNFDALFADWYAQSGPPTWYPPEAIQIDRLLPFIKSRAWLEYAEHDLAARNQPRHRLWSEPYNEDLVVVIGECTHSIRYLRRGELQQTGLDGTQLMQRALRNLAGSVRGRELWRRNATCHVRVGGMIEASLVLLENFWADPSLRSDGRQFLSIPNRDSLIVALRDDPATIWELAETASRRHDSGPYPVTPLLLEYRGAGPLQLLDFAAQDAAHAITDLERIDSEERLPEGGLQLAMRVDGPLDGSPRSVFRLYRKLDGYLRYLESERCHERHGDLGALSAAVRIHCHPDSDPQVLAVLADRADSFRARGATLTIVTEPATDCDRA